MAIDIVPATEDHAVEVAENMREHDRWEIWLAARFAPLPALMVSLEVSDLARTVMMDGEPAMMFGRRRYSMLSGDALIWMLATPAIERRPVAFFRRSVPLMRELFADGVVRLTNAVHVENKLSIRWLSWLGAEFAIEKPYGPYGQPFREFELTKEKLRCAYR